MHRSDEQPDEAGAGPARGDDGRGDDMPPVGQPLVRSRRSGAAGEHPTVVAAEEEVEPPGPLAGRIGVVAGATSALGEAFGVALTERGVRVCLLDHDLAAVRRTASRCGGTDGSMAVRCDPASPEEVADALAFLERAGIRPDLVVHATPLEDRGPDDLDHDDLDHDTGGPGSLAALDQGLGSAVRGPLALSDGFAPLLDPGSQVVFVDLRSDDDPAPGPSRIVAAARRELVTAVRSGLAERQVQVLTVSVLAPDTAEARGDLAEDVADLSLDVLSRRGPNEVTHLLVDLATGTSVVEGSGDSLRE